jgi:glucosamine--fructose-6-phosphate aminotransferase (isomerizing)
VPNNSFDVPDPHRTPTSPGREAASGHVTQMAWEVAQQPEALARTLDALLPRRPEIARLARDRRRILLVARGSSDNAAIYARYLSEVHAGVPASLAAPSVATLYHAELDLSDTIAICVSQSGATEEIVETQEWAQRAGAATVAVTNVAGSPLAGGADVALVTEAGRELAVPAT